MSAEGHQSVAVAAFPHLIVDDLLQPAERLALLDWALAHERQFAPAGVNSTHVSAARSALALRDLGPFAALLRQRMLARLDEWIAALRVSPFEPSLVELEMVAQNDGAFFVIHSDSYAGRSAESALPDHVRLLSAVYYFHNDPPAFAGGELRIHKLGGRQGDEGLDVVPRSGALALFPSWWPHEVRPIYCPSQAFADSRFSVNCWVYRKR